MKSNSGQGRAGDMTCEQAIMRIMKGSGTPFTAYKLARKTGFTPQHINRTLKKMWAFGKVAYRTEPYRNGEKRVWANTTHAALTIDVYCWHVAMERLL